MKTYILSHPEQIILLINIIFVVVSYIFIYPRYVKEKINKLAMYDFVLSLSAAGVAWMIYWGTHISINLYFFDAWWLLYSILTYTLLEIVPAIFYAKEYKITWDTWEK